jgi:hypothetical protein
LRERLDELAPALGFEVCEIDITRDLDLFARYRHEIPVLARDGREIARGRIDERDLQAVVRSAISQ